MISRGLSLNNIEFSYNESPVLDGISLDIPEGQFVSMLGESGSGKSTLLRLVAGLQLPDEGSIHWNGQEVAGPAIERGIVFQDYALFPWMSVADNIAIAIAKARSGTSRAERREEAVSYLRKVGLGAVVHKYPFELSGGMQQRSAIARALAIGSPLLLMDEPFGALDSINRARLQDLLLEVWEAGYPRKTIVFVTHDVDEALYLGDRIVVLGSSPGRVIADLPIDFERKRDRRQLFENESFHALRKQVGDTLTEDALLRLTVSDHPA
jgi:NitT/TauT family transport system ATP-binding protein